MQRAVELRKLLHQSANRSDRSCLHPSATMTQVCSVHGYFTLQLDIFSWKPSCVYHLCLPAPWSIMTDSDLLKNFVILKSRCRAFLGSARLTALALRFTVVNPAASPSQNSWILELWSRGVSGVKAARNGKFVKFFPHLGHIFIKQL